MDFGESALFLAMLVIASWVGLAYSVIAILLGLRKGKYVRSVNGIASGCVGILFGTIFTVMCGHPTGPNREAFFPAAASVVLGLAGVVLGAWRKGGTRGDATASTPDELR